MRLVHSVGVAQQHYVFNLYIAGASAHSSRAIASITHLCEGRLNGRCQLKIIDLYLLPALAKEDNILAVPTLIRKFPLPMRRMIGDLCDVTALLQEDDWSDRP
jgi:circadian clock protein KaiB